MKHYDIIIIGGSAAGLAVLKTCFRLYPNKSKLIIKKEDKTLIPCAIPYIYGEIGNSDNDLIPNDMILKLQSELVLDEVLSVDKENKIVKTKDKGQFSYDKLIFATGSSPIVPHINGIGKENVFFVKKEADIINKLKDTIQKSSNIVIVGGGYIGVEFAEQIKEISPNKNVTIIEKHDRCLANTFDEEFSLEIENKLKYVGVNILKNTTVNEIGGDKYVQNITIQNNASKSKIDCDLVIVAIGVKSNVKIAQNAGLKISEDKSISVNTFMKTSDEDIFACGDCASKFSFFTKKLIEVKLASVATLEGRLIAENLYENHFSNKGIIGVYATKIHDKIYAGAGLIKSIAQKEKMGIVEGNAAVVNRHPGTLKDSSQIKLKLLFNKKSKVLIGVQMSGPKAVGEIINNFSLAIEHQLTVYDLFLMEPGTQPKITASPLAYETIAAAEDALKNFD